MDLVDDTLREWRSTPFAYGKTDCMLSVGRYLARTGHRDVTAQFIGRYGTAEGAEEQMATHGGVPGLMALAGAAEHSGAPARGDVVEVVWAGGLRIGGICTGDMIAMRLQQGVIEFDARFLTIGGVWHGRSR